jgi:hypothetical protein
MIKTHASFRRSGVALRLVGSMILGSRNPSDFSAGHGRVARNETVNDAFEAKRLLRLLVLLQAAKTRQRGLFIRYEPYLEPYQEPDRFPENYRS